VSASAAARLENVSKRFGSDTALEAVSLAVEPGECLALVGHNGSGKSTLIKILLGLLRADAGDVTTLGHAPTAPASVDLRRRIGFLPENVAFDPAMTGRQVMRFYARLKGLAVTDCEPLLARVGLIEAAGRRVRGYSKGMRQRLGLAQALLGDPALLLLDEPTTGLDPALRRRFYDIVFEAKARGCAVLISSHVLSELEAQADRIALLARGRLLACDALGALRTAADLPIGIEIRTRPCATAAVAATLPKACEAEPDGPQSLRVRCRESEKMAVLRIAASSEDVRDVTLAPAGLEALYAHFSDGEGAPV